MNASPIKIAALKRGVTLKGSAVEAGIPPRRFYRLIEGLAVPTDEELARIATVTGLTLDTVRQAFSGVPAVTQES